MLARQSRKRSKPYECLADELRAVPYRPELRRIAESVPAALLLQQMLYWWKRSDYKPYYKFLRPCRHRDYRTGDSWAEELNLSRRELDSALDKIAVKIKLGDNKRAAWESGAFAVFWTDRERKSWFAVNTEAIDRAIEDAGLDAEDQSTSDEEDEPLESPEPKNPKLKSPNPKSSELEEPGPDLDEEGWEDVC